MDITALMLAEREKLEKRLAQELYEYEKAKYPEGRLKIKKDGIYVKYYHVRSSGSKKVPRTYISKKDIKLAQSLAMKAYKDRLIYSLKHEIQAIDAYLRLYPKDNGDALFRISPTIRELIGSEVFPQFDAENWLQEPYDQSTEYPEDLKLMTMKGHYVRSKSEVMIADELYRRGIPYRYECAIELEGETIYPDFTILDPKTGKIYLWEHFGLMDSPKYISKFQYKMGLYPRNGYVPQINLICTFETEANPLTSVNVIDMADRYFGE